MESQYEVYFQVVDPWDLILLLPGKSISVKKDLVKSFIEDKKDDSCVYRLGQSFFDQVSPDQAGQLKISIQGENFSLRSQDHVVLNLSKTNASKWTFHDVKLLEIQSMITLKHGSMQEEEPEQRLAVEFITQQSKVLEIGANIGRNSLVMSHILEDRGRNMISVESDPRSVAKLQENKTINGANFEIVGGALSKRRLIQNGWVTQPLDTQNSPIPAGWFEVKTVTLKDLKERFRDQSFDTLVADCEGALYYILQDTPELLENVQTVIVENDYQDLRHKIFVDQVFTKFGLKVVKSVSGGWGPCTSFFYQVWKKDKQ